MPLPINHVLGILADNLRKRGSVLPLSRRASTRWSKGLGLSKGGETIIYTGQMYQLIPSIDAMASQMAIFENSFITKFFGVGRFVNKFINLSFFMSLAASKEMKKENNLVLRDIVALLKKAGLSFGCLFNEDLYSGALVYDGGVDDVFEAHARRVFDIFKANGVRRVITVDPHTTNILREVYPKFIKDFDIEVVSYLEILEERGLTASSLQDRDLVIHDSCIYARYEGMIDQPRTLLGNMGITVGVPELAGKSTHCCGGPIESLFPGKAHEVAAARVTQLSAEGKDVVTMCPICLVNLRKAGKQELRFTDVSRVLAEGYR